MKSDRKQYNILIVDDDEALREAMAFDFKREGFNVSLAENGKIAFEIVKSNKIHLVISDVRMPGGDGLSLLAEIRNYDPSIPMVIFVTGFANTTEAECLEKGAKKVIAKPFQRRHLIDSALDALGIEDKEKNE